MEPPNTAASSWPSKHFCNKNDYKHKQNKGSPPTLSAITFLQISKKNTYIQQKSDSSKLILLQRDISISSIKQVIIRTCCTVGHWGKLLKLSDKRHVLTSGWPGILKLNSQETQHCIFTELFTESIWLVNIFLSKEKFNTEKSPLRRL